VQYWRSSPANSADEILRFARGSPLIRKIVVQPWSRAVFWAAEQSMQWREHITVDPAVMHGQACVRGTRVPVAVVLANLAEGLSAAEIVASYPTLTPEGVQAALAYASELAQERVLDLPA
jgi:uncharacterized protein (DUF433 family)